jgi:hypothetical protein
MRRICVVAAAAQGARFVHRRLGAPLRNAAPRATDCPCDLPAGGAAPNIACVAPARYRFDRGTFRKYNFRQRSEANTLEANTLGGWQ